MSFAAILRGLFQGLGITLGVTALGMLYAVPFAFVAGLLQRYARGAVYLAVTAVIEFWRSTPVIILLFAFYYSLPAFGIRLSGIAVASLVLGLNIGGYASQSVRAALQCLDPGQAEAGRSLGLRSWQVVFLIELPQALRAMLPTFVNEFIQLVKGTALVSLITLTDMTFRAKEISQAHYDPAGVYSALLVAYFVICYPVTIVGRRLERMATAGGGPRHEF